MLCDFELADAFTGQIVSIQKLESEGYKRYAKRPCSKDKYVYLFYNQDSKFPWCIYSNGTGSFWKTRREALIFAYGQNWISRSLVIDNKKKLNPAVLKPWEEL